MTTRLIALLLVLAAPLALADTLVLKSGGKVEGKLLARKGDKIHFQTRFGEAIFDAASVVEVITGKTVVDEYKERHKALAFTDAAGHFALGQWCREQGMIGEWRDQMKQVLEIDADHAGARQSLGHLQHQGRWLTTPDELRSAGYREYLGRWYTAEQLAKVEQSPEAQAKHEKLRKQINGLLKSMAGKNDRQRTKARDDLMVLARVQNMPDLAKLAGSLYKRYNDYYTNMRYVTVEVRAQLATVKQPIDTVVTTIASGNSGDLTDPDNDTSSNPAAVTIDVPQVELIDVRTTVIVPAGTGRR